MKIKIFTNRLYLGYFDAKDFLVNNDSISIGTIIKVDNKEYCINTLSLIKPSLMIMEVC
ncbi:hypothetical protein [Bacillus sonorensis]|uniref:hypothetical protein n=1 Tax=Bacillus sonorensis TaxID=119858 RepID=UPI0015C30984|nr:hypothetical protein [Bacillus sonorensis]